MGRQDPFAPYGRQGLGSIYGALPVAIAVFPQEMKIDVNVLEPEFRQAKDKSGKAIEYVLCNKGL